jgi:hypothetical protein
MQEPNEVLFVEFEKYSETKLPQKDADAGNAGGALTPEPVAFIWGNSPSCRVVHWYRMTL